MRVKVDSQGAGTFESKVHPEYDGRDECISLSLSHFNWSGFGYSQPLLRWLRVLLLDLSLGPSNRRL